MNGEWWLAASHHSRIISHQGESMRRTLKWGIVGALAFSAGVALSPLASYAEKQKDDIYDMLNLFNEVFQRVRTDYVEPVKDNDLIEAAINGMLSSLDPHSSYLNEKSFKEMQVQTKGEFGGLGIEVTMDSGLVKVVSPIDDTPAFKAGVHAGDYISAIDDEPVMGMTLSDAVDKMRGAPDTKIKITVLREGEKEPLDFVITRAVIRIQPVRSRAMGDIAYLRITQFNEQTTDKLKSEWAKQKKAIGTVKGIVLDLRNNPGGLLDQAVGVSDAFLDEGEIVSTRGRDPENTRRYMAHGNNIAKGIPMVVLINNGSASAAEIVAGALQDHKRGVLMGIKSFGKGSVQTIMPLPGHGAMRLTTARYFTPSGHSIQAKGIVPDIVVEQAKIEPIKKSNMERLEASLPHRLRGEDELKALKEAAKQEGAAKDNASAHKDHRKTDDVTDRTIDGDISASEDFQLSRALDLLRSLAIYKGLN
jgi:carboxyl-terminal processing protease